MRDLPKDVRAIALVVIVGAVMSILDTTIVNVALETLRVDLNSPLSTIQWVSTGYLLALATVIPLTGWAAERFGPRRVWMTVVAAFVLTSALCGLAWNVESLIAFRVLQGAAGGMIMPIGMITLAQAAGPKRMGRVMSIVGVPMVLAPVLGPVLGGLIVDNLSWRWIFLVNLPVGAAGLVMAYRLLPRGRAAGTEGIEAGEQPTLDLKGLAMLSPGVALLVFGLSEFGTQRTFTGSVSVWLPVLASIVLLVAFVRHAWRAAHPLVDVRLFRNPGFSAAAATTFLVGIALFGSMLLLPLYYQLARGESPLTAGLLLVPQGLGAALSMNIGGRLTDRIGAGPVVLGGLAILVAGTLVFCFVGPDTSYWLLGGALFLRGLGLGGTMMPSMAAAYATLDRAQVPRATPQLNVIQRVGGALGAALLTVALQNRITSEIAAAQAGAGSAAGLPSGGDGLSGRPLTQAARERLAEPLAAAFAHTYWWALAMTVLAFVPAAVLARVESRARRQTRGDAADEAREAGADPSGTISPCADGETRERVTVRVP
ncbi:MAG: family efflux transporter permease subunit [Solirubrobacterales bacterium]|nr:family efflux transporter permease subunit [Solirubrobacterales bacterium]